MRRRGSCTHQSRRRLGLGCRGCEVRLVDDDSAGGRSSLLHLLASQRGLSGAAWPPDPEAKRLPNLTAVAGKRSESRTFRRTPGIDRRRPSHSPPTTTAERAHRELLVLHRASISLRPFLLTASIAASSSPANLDARMKAFEELRSTPASADRRTHTAAGCGLPTPPKRMYVAPAWPSPKHSCVHGYASSPASLPSGLFLRGRTLTASCPSSTVANTPPLAPALARLHRAPAPALQVRRRRAQLSSTIIGQRPIRCFVHDALSTAVV